MLELSSPDTTVAHGRGAMWWGYGRLQQGAQVQAAGKVETLPPGEVASWFEHAKCSGNEDRKVMTV